MNDEAELYFQRAENELITAQVLFDVSSKFFKTKPIY